MIRFTTLVNPNTAYTRTKEGELKMSAVGDNQDRASTRCHGVLFMFSPEATVGVIYTEKQAASHQLSVYPLPQTSPYLSMSSH